MTDEIEQAKKRELLLDLMHEWWDPPQHLIQTLPRGGTKLSYLGHADTTRAMSETDPEWTWTPMAHDENGLPILDRDSNGHPIGMWIWITVCGVERPAYGSCEPGKRDAVKELIGDAIRNGAMRFGVAGGLWSKGEWDGEQKPESGFDAKKQTDLLKKTYGDDVVKAIFALHDIKKYGDLTEDKLSEIKKSLTEGAQS
jgi:hypothetical protein